MAMEGRGGCCLVRYAGDSDVPSKVDRIMLRFRPIAPKPVLSSGVGLVANAAMDGCRGNKRRGVRKEGRRGRKRRVGLEERDKKMIAPDPVTLPLMPETPERKESPAPPSGHVVPSYVPTTMWRRSADPVAEGNSVVAPRPVRPTGSWVTVECLTDTCWEVERLRSCCTDEEVRCKLEDDGCPAFLSDEMDRVKWTNDAYRRMVGSGLEEDGEVTVALLTRVKLPAREECRAFTCQVRVRYACRGEKGSLTAPCDVWRLGDGRFVWMLDVTAALSLGR